MCPVEMPRDVSAFPAARVGTMPSVDSYSKAAIKRAMKVQEVMLRAEGLALGKGWPRRRSNNPP